MSAPNAGRQSPEPETQSHGQVGKTAEPNDQGAAPSSDHAKDASVKQLAGLESNPKGPLDDEADKKTSKN